MNSRASDALENPLEGVDGGAGSGNWGHKGRPGLRGGSGKGGGSHFRTGSKAEGFKAAFNKVERGLLKKAVEATNYSDFWFSIRPKELEALKAYGFNEYEQGAVKRLYDSLLSAEKSRRESNYTKGVARARKRGIIQSGDAKVQAAKQRLKSTFTDELNKGEQSKLFGGLYSESAGQFAKHIPKIAETLSHSIDTMDDRLVPIVERSLKNCSLAWKSMGHGPAYYSEGKGVITIDADWYLGDSGIRDSVDFTDTFWHEFGHYVDDLKLSKSGEPTVVNEGEPYEYRLWKASEIETYHPAAVDDVNALLKNIFGDEFHAMQSSNSTSNFGTRILDKKDDVMSIPAGASPEQINKIDDGINGYLKKMFGTVDYDEYWSAYGKPARPNFDDYFVYYVSPKGKKSYYKDKFKGASDEWSRINREHYDAIEEWKASFDYAAANAKYEELESAAAKRKAHFSYVSDCLDAATMGTVTTFMGYGGHGYDYYHKPTHTSSNSQNETFANIFTMLANNDSEAVRQMSTLLPSVYNAFLDQMEVKFGG